MKKFKRTLSFLLVLSMLFTMSLSVLTGCDSGSSGDETTGGSGEAPGDETTGGSGGGTESGKVDYKITVKSAGGLLLEDVTLLIYSDAAMEDLAGYASTDESGVATASLKAGGSYYIDITDAPEGYALAESYPMIERDTTITLTSSVITDNTSLSGVVYKVGSVMRDFSFTDTDGETVTLSEILKTKKAVLINFFYTTCGPCISEVPYMEEAYQMYKDDVEILALNPYANDDQMAVKLFKEEYELSFIFGKDTAGVKDTLPSFGGYPTTMIVDRYGVICLIETGALPALEPFEKAFEYFTADNYTQKLFTSIGELTPAEKPEEPMPSTEELAAALGTTDLGFTYSGEKDDEYSWPFKIGEKDGETCVYPTNKNQSGSYSILYATMNLKKGDVVALDYFASSEQGADILYLLVNRDDIYQISGISEDWATCYVYVAPQDGEYELALCYFKDATTNAGDDTVYVKDLRVEKIADIDAPTYIPRNAATNLKADGFGYEDYVTVVLNEEDGYYHVGTADGPLLLAELMTATQFSSDSVWTLAYDGKVGEGFYDKIVNYCSYASNSEIYSFVPVTTELREYLEMVAEAVGIEQSENEWLQMCSYYEAYGTNGKQLSDPTKGLWWHSAYDAQLGKNNSVTYNRVIMPRGLLYEFIPQQTGVYRINSLIDSDNIMDSVEGWVFLRNGEIYYEYENAERLHNDIVNCSMIVYMEAGTPYYIDIAYWDTYKFGTFNFEIKYVGAKLEVFTLASPGPFTFYEAEDGTTDQNEIVAGGIEVILDDDGYYHELRADGSVGSIIYADFLGNTSIFERTCLKEMVEKTESFNFAISDTDQWVLDFLEIFEKDGVSYQEGFKIEWGDEYDAYMEMYQVEDVVAGRYHGDGQDYTEVMKGYVKKMIAKSSANPELEGCVPVTEELAEILQLLMDKFTFAGVDHSWTKLCYYYETVGA